MSFAVSGSPNEGWHIILEDEPPYCLSLHMAPKEIEIELKQGLWLVLMFSIWNPLERIAIGTALSVIREFEGRVQLGIRPFDSHDEIRTWCPELQSKYASPVWLILREGKIVGEHWGLRTNHQLTEMLSPILMEQ